MIRLILFFCFSVYLFSRPLGEGYAPEGEVDFEERWNHELELPKAPVSMQLEAPYWTSHKQKHLDALGLTRDKVIEPFKTPEPSVEVQIGQFHAQGWDQALGNKGLNGGGFGQNIRFSTKGAGSRLVLRQKVAGYDSFFDWTRFEKKQDLSGDSDVNGYLLHIGDRSSAFTARSDTDLGIYAAGVERFLDQRTNSTFSLIQGLSLHSLDRFERIRGIDTLGLNKNKSTILPGDPIVIEQGEDHIHQRGFGPFAGLVYRSFLGQGLIWHSSLALHLHKQENNQDLLVQRVSKAGLIETVRRNGAKNEKTTPITDFQLGLNKYFRNFYNFGLQARFTQFNDDERASLSGGNLKNLGLRGVTASIQRFF